MYLLDVPYSSSLWLTYTSRKLHRLHCVGLLLTSSTRETKNRTLEDIAAAFGDKVVTLTEDEVVAEQTVFEGKAKSDYAEND